MNKYLHPLAYLVVAILAFKIGEQKAPHETPETHESQDLPEASEPTPETEAMIPASNTQSVEQARQSLREIHATENNHKRFEALKSYFEGMTAENVDRYLAEVQDLPPGPLANSITRQLFTNWGKTDGEAAFQYAQNLTGRDRLGYLSAAAAGWATDEPEIAWAAVMDISNNGSMYGISTYNVLNSIAKDDLELAAKLTLQVKDDRRRTSAFGYLVRQVSTKGNYEELFDIAIAIDGQSNKENFVKSIFETWGKYETEAPNRLLSTIEDPSVSSSAIQGMMSGWAAVDGSGAFSYALTNRAEPGMEDALQSITRTWARSVTAPEMEAMMAQVSTVEDSSKFMQSMIYSVAQANPQLAMDWAASTSDEGAKWSAVSSSMSSWTRSDIKGAEAYYHTMSDEGLRTKSVFTLATGLITKGATDERIIALLNGFDDPKHRANTLSSLAFAVSKSKSRNKSESLDQTLRELIETSPDMTEQQREAVLKNLQ